MGSFSNYLENEILDHLFGKATYASPTIYVGLSTSDPGDDGAGLAEPSGGSYARVATAATDWNTASSGSLDNATAIEFAEASASWGTITHFALFDAASSGNMLAHGSLTTSKTVSSGDTASFAAGALDITLD